VFFFCFVLLLDGTRIALISPSGDSFQVSKSFSSWIAVEYLNGYECFEHSYKNILIAQTNCGVFEVEDLKVYGRVPPPAHPLAKGLIGLELG